MEYITQEEVKVVGKENLNIEYEVYNIWDWMQD